jgi:hypothetical protein
MPPQTTSGANFSPEGSPAHRGGQSSYQGMAPPMTSAPGGPPYMPPASYGAPPAAQAPYLAGQQQQAPYYATAGAPGPYAPHDPNAGYMPPYGAPQPSGEKLKTLSLYRPHF